MDFLKRVVKYMWHRIQGVVEKVSKSNAMYPLLIALIFSIVFAGVVIGLVSNPFIQFAAMLPVLGIVFQILRSFQFFATTNPDMLRTETYVIQKQVLDMFGDERTGLHPSAEHVVAVINPANPIKPSDRLELGSADLPIEERDHD